MNSPTFQVFGRTTSFRPFIKCFLPFLLTQATKIHIRLPLTIGPTPAFPTFLCTIFCYLYLKLCSDWLVYSARILGTRPLVHLTSMLMCGVSRKNSADITCDQLNCAKGTCKMNSSSSHSGNSYNYSYSYSCQCENGWAVPPLGVFLPFAPCALPNCTAATNCSDSVRPPPPTFTMPSNFSDPCSWAFCGGGDCVATSTYSYTCNCKAGFQNLFNSSVFPCYDDCSIGTECKKQGVGFLNATAGTPAVGGQGSSGGGSGSQGGANTAVPDSFLALLIIMLSLAMVIV